MCFVNFCRIENCVVVIIITKRVYFCKIYAKSKGAFAADAHACERCQFYQLHIKWRIGLLTLSLHV